MNIQQGEIYWANLNPVKGHEQAGMRPVFILQNNILNKNLNTVIIAPITKNLKAKGLLTTFFLDKKISSLKFNSVLLLSQIRTIDKKRLEQLISKLPKETVQSIKQQLQFVF